MPHSKSAVTTSRCTPTRALVLALAASLGAASAHAQATPAVTVIPYPASVTVDSSVRFVLGPRATIALSSPGNAELRALGAVAAEVLSSELGAKAAIASGRAGSGTPSAIALVLAPGDSSAGPESYRLDVAGSGLTIAAPRAAGLFYGLQTLRSLL
jgi:hexosaminidase